MAGGSYSPPPPLTLSLVAVRRCTEADEVERDSAGDGDEAAAAAEAAAGDGDVMSGLRVVCTGCSGDLSGEAAADEAPGAGEDAADDDGGRGEPVKSDETVRCVQHHSTQRPTFGHIEPARQQTDACDSHSHEPTAQSESKRITAVPSTV